MVIGWTDRRMERRRRRLALDALTDAQLKDMGLSRSEIDGSIRRYTGIDRLESRHYR
jgi:uncharacterized protein YjiS (DUF1127 family)